MSALVTVEPLRRCACGSPFMLRLTPQGVCCQRCAIAEED